MRNEKSKAITGVLLFFVPVLLILFYWKNTLLHMGTHLYDWNDVPFVIWIFQNNIKSIATFDLIYHNETNAMYPFPYSLSFTEHMYFPSFIVYIISLFTSNPILQFNILAIANHLLLYVCSYLLAGRFTKNNLIKVIMGFFIAFSPYMFVQSGHFQMLFFWPLLLSIYFMLHPERQLHHFLLAGVFLGWQFMSSVYVGIMGLFMAVSYYLVRLIAPSIFPWVKTAKKDLVKKSKAFLFGFYTKWDERGPSDRLRILVELAVILVVFLIVCEPTLEAYFEMNATYKPSIEQGQYVTYAAHITDYLFPSGQSSLLYRSLGFWRGINRHSYGELAAFIGFVPTAVIGFWLLGLKKTKSKTSAWLIAWAAIMLAAAFIFSLGPRFNFNGKYLVFPLPYLAVLKTVPFIGVMRALARWYLVIILALSLLFTVSLEKFKKTMLLLILLFLAVEFYPAPLSATSLNWQTKSYGKVRELCRENPAPMLEYPFDYRAKDKSISRDLAYKNSILLASTTHNCDILSGFTAYVPQKYLVYRDFFQNRDFNRGGLKLLHELGFKYVKFNLEAMNIKEKDQIKRFLKLRYTTKLYEDMDTIIIQVRQLSKFEMIETIR